MRRCGFAIALVGVLSMGSIWGQPVQAAFFYGPSPYLNFLNDSPFVGGSYHYLENETFEDGFLSSAGVSASGGIVLGPGDQTDSVDKDLSAQVIDGSGTNGRSYYSNGTTSLTFSFIPANLSGGVYPSNVGIVWTDVGVVTAGNFGVANVVFEAFGPGNVSLGIIGPVLLGDGAVTGATAEDRFFGVFNAAGVSKITVSVPDSTDWEVDNLQFGLAMVPEPTSALIWGVLLVIGASIRRRRQ